jgi:hypothetical protein
MKDRTGRSAEEEGKGRKSTYRDEEKKVQADGSMY